MALGLVVLSGCVPQHKDAILFGVNTTGGVKVGVDERQTPTVILGYNRQEATLVPLLVHGDGLVNAANQDVGTTAYLELAKERFDAAEKATGRPRDKLTKEGVLLVNWAYEAAAGAATRDKTAPPVSPGLEELHALAQQASPDPTRLRLLTEAEIRRPSTAMRFLAEHKYVAEEGKDAYSVLGTFTGGAKGKATMVSPTAVEASGSLSQYFATGIAAQNLSRTPASVSANPEAVGRATDVIALQDARRTEFAEGKRQEQVNQILGAIDTLDDASAIDLAENPPVTNPESQKIVELRDPNARRTMDGDVARRMLKTMVILGRRSDTDLDKWEAAVRAQ